MKSLPNFIPNGPYQHADFQLFVAQCIATETAAHEAWLRTVSAQHLPSAIVRASDNPTTQGFVARWLAQHNYRVAIYPDHTCFMHGTIELARRTGGWNTQMKTWTRKEGTIPINTHTSDDLKKLYGL